MEKIVVGKEIERKFLVKYLPSTPDTGIVAMTQGYLPGEALDVRQAEHVFYQVIPGDNQRFIIPEALAQALLSINPSVSGARLRKEITLSDNTIDYVEAVKGGFGVSKDEEQANIPAPLFDGLWPHVGNNYLTKNRHYFSLEDGYIAELDKYREKLLGLFTVEVEFPTVAKAEAFVAPAWFGDEITNDVRYTNKNLAEHGHPVYTLSEGVTVLERAIHTLLEESKDPIILLVAGGSASGKTSAVATKIAASFASQAFIFSLDNYYKGPEYMQAQIDAGNPITYDDPDMVDLDLARNHLMQLQRGDTIDMPIYSFKESRVTHTVPVQAHKLIIVEGLYALHDAIRDVGTLSTFVDVGKHGSFVRRLFRDVHRSSWTPNEILRYHLSVVDPKTQEYVAPQKKHAMLVINNDYKEQEESLDTRRVSSQVKYPLSLEAFTEIQQTKSVLLGASFQGVQVEEDFYYQPADRDFSQTGEMMRVRKSNGVDTMYSLTYKGPQLESVYNKKATFDCIITPEVKALFDERYGTVKSYIHKYRLLYQYGDFTIALDRLYDGVQKSVVAHYLEVRSSHKGIDLSALHDLLKVLGVDPMTADKRSYIDIVSDTTVNS